MAKSKKRKSPARVKRRHAKRRASNVKTRRNISRRKPKGKHPKSSRRISKHRRVRTDVRGGGVQETRKFYKQYDRISRGKPSSKWYHSRYKVFSSRKRETGKQRFITCSVFALVRAPMNVKTSEATGTMRKQVWIRRILLGAPTSIKSWAKYLSPPNGFLYLEVKAQVEGEDGDSGNEFIEIIGFEGVR
jgi:hypothetical protein